MVKLSEIFVSCHAPGISSLLYETARSPHDQKGLLIGEIGTETVTTKADDIETITEQRTTIYLEHSAPLKETEVFGNLGNVDKEKLQKYLNQYSNKIVGWYSFRRNTDIGFRTLQEVLTHKSLLDNLPSVKPDQFVVAFITTFAAPNLSTHTTNYIFMRYIPDKHSFQPVNFKIHTLSEKIKAVNGYSVSKPFPTSSSFENIVNPNRDRTNCVLSVLSINRSINEHLKFMNKKLGETEKTRAELGEEIKNLKQCLAMHESQDVRINEMKPEPGMVCIKYNPKINYNPDRRENPIKVVQRKVTPRKPRQIPATRKVRKPSVVTGPPAAKNRKLSPSQTAKPRKTVKTVSVPPTTGEQAPGFCGGAEVPKVNPPSVGDGVQFRKPAPPQIRAKDKQGRLLNRAEVSSSLYNLGKLLP